MQPHFFGLRENEEASHLSMSGSGPTLAALRPWLKSVILGSEQHPSVWAQTTLPEPHMPLCPV